jgi:hypothetical protein
MRPRRSLLAAALCICAPAAPAQTLLFIEPGDVSGDQAGTALALVGDVDADGAEDFALGAPFNDVGGNFAGMARVYSGRTRLPLHTWYGALANERFGSALFGAGDVDGDGHDDVLVGAPGGNYVELFSGLTGLSLQHITGPSGAFGRSLAGGGDVDGDGVPDVLVGAPYGAPGGRLVVISGATWTPIRTHAAGCSSYLGFAAAFLGDVDGDGRDEYVVGRPLPNFGCGSPEVLAYDGATGALLWSNSAPQSTDQLGWSVAPLADFSGDGVPEVLAGAPQDPGVGCGPCNGFGFVRLLDGATGNLLWQVDGTSQYSGLGFALAGIGDVDGNGYEDFAVSQPSTEGCGTNTQPLQIRDGEAGALLLQLPPPAQGDAFGVALASGDVNADGLRDILVGTPCDDAGGLNSGAARAYSIVLEVVPYCWPKLNSQGCTPLIYTAGAPSVTAGTLRVKALDVINNQVGFAVWGRAPAATPFQGGYLCVSAPFARTDVQNSGGNPPPADCSGTYSFHFSAPYMAAMGVQPGEQLYCQYWARDPQGVAGLSLTGGLAFRVLP